MQHPSTADIDTLIRPLLHRAFQLSDLLTTAAPVRKAFTTDVGQMQWRRHHMATRTLALQF